MYSNLHQILIEIIPYLGCNCLNTDIDGFLRDFTVEIPETVLKFEKLDHKFAAVIENCL